MIASPIGLTYKITVIHKERTVNAFTGDYSNSRLSMAFSRAASTGIHTYKVFTSMYSCLQFPFSPEGEG